MKNSSWELYRDLYKEFGYKLRIAVHKKVMEGQKTGFRQGSESLEIFIIENNEQESFSILNEIANKLRGNK